MSFEEHIRSCWHDGGKRFDSVAQLWKEYACAHALPPVMPSKYSRGVFAHGRTLYRNYVNLHLARTDVTSRRELKETWKGMCRFTREEYNPAYRVWAAHQVRRGFQPQVREWFKQRKHFVTDAPDLTQRHTVVKPGRHEFIVNGSRHVSAILKSHGLAGVHRFKVQNRVWNLSKTLPNTAFESEMFGDDNLSFAQRRAVVHAMEHCPLSPRKD